MPLPIAYTTLLHIARNYPTVWRALRVGTRASELAMDAAPSVAGGVMVGGMGGNIAAGYIDRAEQRKKVGKQALEQEQRFLEEIKLHDDRKAAGWRIEPSESGTANYYYPPGETQWKEMRSEPRLPPSRRLQNP